MKPEIEQDEQILQSIEPYKTELEEEVEKELCYNLRLLTKREAALETSLVNLLADICLAAGYSIYKAETGRGVDFALFITEN